MFRREMPERGLSRVHIDTNANNRQSRRIKYNSYFGFGGSGAGKNRYPIYTTSYPCRIPRTA